MSHVSKRQRWSEGSLVRIELGDLGVAYGQMLQEPEYAFFAAASPTASLAEIVASPVLFRLWVSRRAHATGRWAKLGTAPIAPALTEPVLRFNQDPLDPSRILLGYDGVSGRVSTAEECRGFERAAVWEPEHVEERLKSGRLGHESVWERHLSLAGP